MEDALTIQAFFSSALNTGFFQHAVRESGSSSSKGKEKLSHAVSSALIQKFSWVAKLEEVPTQKLDSSLQVLCITLSAPLTPSKQKEVE